MRFLLNVLSLGLLVVGFIGNNSEIAVSGSTVYLLAQAFYLYDSYHHSKKFANNRDATINPAKKSSFVDRMTSLLEGTVIIFGLIAMVSGRAVTAGAIIWFGAIFVYFLWGIIIEIITGIPLRFGYGGWEIRRNRQRKK